MELQRLNERIWLYPFEEERDRPNLGYIRGDRWSLAVDAGHSEAHTREFYRALEEEGLPLPSLTVLTHWHWDHTLGMHAVHGLCLASARTNDRLKALRERIANEGREALLSLDECIRLEYAGDRPVVVTLADMVYTGALTLDLGGCPVRVFEAPAPHTDDSTLILAQGTLFLGDSTSGAFPTWEKDPALTAALRAVVAQTDAETCVHSHWTPMTMRECLDEDLA